MSTQVKLGMPLMIILGSQATSEGVYFPHLFLIILFLFNLYKSIIWKNITIPRNLLFLTISFLLTVVLSFYEGINIDSIKGSTQLAIFYIAIIYCCMQIKNFDDIDILIKSLSIGLFFNALTGLSQSLEWILNNGFVLISNGEWFRIKGLCGSPTDYVMQLIAGLFLTNFISKSSYRISIKILYITLLVLSMSRSAYVVIFILMFYYVFGLMMKIKILNLIYLFVFLFMLLNLIYQLDSDFIIYQRILDIGSNELNNRRFAVIEDAFTKAIYNNKTLTIGNGYGSYLFYNHYADEYFDNIHNIYLHIFYSSGLSGFIVFSSLLIYILFKIIRIKNNRHLDGKYNKYSELKNYLLILFLSILLIGFVETNITSIGTGWLVGIIFGIPIVLNRKKISTNH